MLIFFSLAAFISTLLGGLFALRFRDKLHLVLGLSAGAVLGVALFDLLPEAFELAQATYGSQLVTLCIGLGFIVYFALNNWLGLHAHGEDDCGNSRHKGIFGAGSLSVHSFLDGLAIGLAFKVSSALGLVVGIAVLAHDFSDGINTVSLILRHRGTKSQAFTWLIIDALAPIAGALATTFIFIPGPMLGLILAVFCGFFLYISISDLLPEAHHEHSSIVTTLMTILGMAIIYLAVYFAGA